MRFFLSIFILCFCLTACANQSQSVAPFDSTLSTIKAPGLSFPAGSIFSWSPATSHFFGDPRLNNSDIHGMLRQSMEHELVRRGYRVGRAGGYSVSYVAALERALSDADINKHFGINPGLPGQQSGQTYEKGTVIIDISDPATQKSLWRSAMQGYVQMDLPKSTRQERIKRLVALMFRNFPRGN